MGGAGPAADAANNIYFVTANGTYDVYRGGWTLGSSAGSKKLRGLNWGDHDYYK
jgi:hypothetical protein